MATQALGITFQYSHTIGRGEFSGPGFRNPVAMARGEDDTMYVVNRSYEYRPDGKRITICTVDEEYIGEFARGVHTAGETEENENDGSLIWPTSVAIDKDGNVYVADEWLNRISMFTQDGDWIGKWGVKGSGDGEINGPSGMAFDADNNLLIVDSQNHRVQKFTKDGQYISQWGREGTGDGELGLPWGIAIDNDGAVFVADWRNDRIQKFSADGQFLLKIGGPGQGRGELNRPTSVDIDTDGLIYVADWGNDRMQVFDREGDSVAVITGDATISKWGKDKLDANSEMWQEREIAQGIEREKNFWGPVAVEVDDEGRIFVVESCRQRIQVYRKQEPMFFGGRL
jgi:DNA-binding beta-propeller fold protein YncE